MAVRSKVIWTKCHEDVHEIIKGMSEETGLPMAHVAGELLREALKLGPVQNGVTVQEALARHHADA